MTDIAKDFETLRGMLDDFTKGAPVPAFERIEAALVTLAADLEDRDARIDDLEAREAKAIEEAGKALHRRAVVDGLARRAALVREAKLREALRRIDASPYFPSALSSIKQARLIARQALTDTALKEE